MNPFEVLENKLDKIERLISSNKQKAENKQRYVNLTEFAKYSGLSKHTIYSKLSRSEGTGIPGAFKSGPKQWLFDLDQWDKYLEVKKAEFEI